METRKPGELTPNKETNDAVRNLMMAAMVMCKRLGGNVIITEKEIQEIVGKYSMPIDGDAATKLVTVQLIPRIPIAFQIQERN